jgi:23S rRNA pseudouridine2605 synthase
LTPRPRAFVRRPADPPAARPRPAAPPPSRPSGRELRLQKFLAEAGVASRRAAEQLIRDGHVSINGQVVSELGVRITPGRDHVTVDGRQVWIRRKLYLALNKPRGYVCSRADEEGRPTITELLPPEWHHLFTVGRLDFNSEGLLLLTNDGEFSLRLTHPRYGVRKIYQATLSARLQPEALAQLTRGVFSEGDRLRADRVRLLPGDGAKSIVELELAEGKNREVRRMFEALGIFVKRLVRTQIGSLPLGRLKTGQWRTLTEPEIKSLLSPA